MSEFHFERYTEQATQAAKAPISRVSNGVLIQGIEDIGGLERTAIAKAIPQEAALVAKALHVARVEPIHTIERSPLVLVGLGRATFKKGWYMGGLVDGAPYMEQTGRVQHEDEAGIILGVDGQIYAFSSHMTDDESIANGVVLNRYAPVCASSMNDRAALYGLATLAARHNLDVQPLQPPSQRA